MKFVADVNTAPYPVGSIIFAAPDVDQNDFKAQENNVAGLFQSLYAFSYDFLLQVLSKLNSKLVSKINGPRAGEGGDNLIQIDESKVEVIDAEAPGHSAIFADPSVIQDLVKIWETHHHAERRGLIAIKKPGRTKYWQLAR